MFKKILIMLSIVGMIVIPRVAWGDTVTVSDSSGYPGDTGISVPITVSDTGSREIYGIDLWLTYDANLIQAVQVNRGSLTQDWSLIANTTLPGEVRVALYHTASLASGGGGIAQILFDVDASAQQGQISSLHLSRALIGDVAADQVVDGSFEILSPINQPPILAFIGNKQVEEGTTLVFNITATDPDSDPLTYSANNLPFGANFDSLIQAFSWTPDYTQAGEYSGVHFEVSDGREGIDSEDITIIVDNVNRAPVLEPIGNKAIATGEPLQFTISATDPDDNLLTYTASNLPYGASFTGQLFSWTPEHTQSGNYSVTFTVTDGTLSDSEIITVQVSLQTYTLNIAVTGQGQTQPAAGTYTHNAGSLVSIQAIPDTGYHFSAWSGDVPSGSELDNPLELIIDQDRAITANFQINIYSLTVNSGTGDGTYNHAEVVSIQADPAQTGYHFSHWSGDTQNIADINAASTTITILADAVVTANYAINTYTLGITAVNGSVSQVPDQASYDYGTVVSLTATADSGYHFLNWSGDLSGSANSTTITMDVDKTVSAVFEIDITVAVGSSSGHPGDSSIAIPITVSNTGSREIYSIDLILTYDANLIQAVQVNKGSLTQDWSLVVNTTLPGEVRIALYHTASLASGGGAIAQILFDVDASAQQGQISSLHLSRALIGDVAADQVVHGSFQILAPITYTLNIAVNGQGQTQPAAGTYTLNAGSLVSIQAIPDTGYSFSGWSGDIPSGQQLDNPLELIIDQDRAITANFQINTYTLTVNSGTGDGTYNHAEVVSIQADPAQTGYHFSHWSGDTQNIADINAASTTIIMDADKTVSANFEIDNHPPRFVSSTPVDGSLVNSLDSLIIYLSDDNDVDEAGTTIVATKDGVSFTNFTRNNSVDNQITLNITSEGDGLYAFTITPLDNESLSGTSVTVRITLDATAPLVIITSPADGSYTSQLQVTLAGTVDGVAFSETRDLPNEGNSILTKQATDLAGNTGSASITVIRDTVAPVVIISSPADGSYTNQLQVTLAGTVDGVAFSEPRDLSNEGENILTKEATDLAGNTGSASVTVIRDTIAPDVQITSPADEAIVNSTPVTVIYTIDGVEYQDTEDLVEGLNTIERTATDLAGNAGSDSITVTLDTQGPSLSIIAPANGSFINDTTPELEYSTNGVVIEVLLDAQALLPIPASGDELPELAEGVHTLSITCEDAAHNRASVQLSFTVDITPPEVIISSPEDGSYSNQTSITVVYTVDGVEYTDTENLSSEGENTITRSNTDLAGNSGSDSIELIRDTIAPVISITEPTQAALLTNNAILNVSGEIKEDGSGIKWVKLNENVLSLIGDNFTSTLTLEEGLNTITIECLDKAGNQAQSEILATLDTQVPTGFILINQGSAYTNDSEVTLTLSAEDPAPGLGIKMMQLSNDGVNFPELEDYKTTKEWSLTPSDGQKRVFVRFQDEAGNLSSVVSADILFDQTEPIINITEPTRADILTNNPVFRILGNITEEGSGIEWVRVNSNNTSVSGNDFSYDLSLNEGFNKITVECRDKAGNSAGPQTFEVTLKTKVAFTIIQPNKQYLNATDLISGTSDIIVLFSIDDETAIRSKRATLKEGSNTVRLTAEDFLGNQGQYDLTPTLDTTAPQITITSHSDGQSVSSQPITLEGTVVDSGSGISYVKVNAKLVTLSGNNFSTSINLSEVANTINVEAKDNVDNLATFSLTLNYAEVSTSPVEEERKAPIYVAPILIDMGTEEEEEEEKARTKEKPRTYKEVVAPRERIVREREIYPEKPYQEYQEPAPRYEPTYREAKPSSIATRKKQPISKIKPSVSREKRAEPIKPTIKVKQVRRFLFWRTYKFEVEPDIKPFYWQLTEETRLPFGLRLDKKRGFVYGIVFGKTEFNLKLNIITEDRRRIEIPCKVKVE